MAMKTKPVNLVVGPVRLSYLHVFKPRPHFSKEGVEEYSATLLIPKEPTKQCPNPREVGKQISDLVKNLVLGEWGDLKPAQYKNPLKDGDTECSATTGEPKHPGYWFIRVASRAGDDWMGPVLIDGDRKHVKGPGAWEAGDWGRVKIRLYAYDNGSKGIGAGLEAVQFLYKDEPFGKAQNPDAIAAEFDVDPNADKPTASAYVEEEDPFLND
jgi:hypothetical protein